MKRTLIMEKKDVNANTRTTASRNEASDANVLRMVGGSEEILKNHSGQALATNHPSNASVKTTWSSYSPRSISLNCCKPNSYINARIPTRYAYGRYRNTMNMITQPSLEDGKVNDASTMNGSYSDTFGRMPRSITRRSESEVSTSRSEPPKKVTPVKLMRTPSAVIRKRSSGSGPSPSDGKRLDEELEELDAHLMGTTLKNIKFMHGSAKFTVFNDIAFQRDCLESHNKVRQLYGSPLLSWCQELADEAETWAQTVAERGRVLYKELPGVGENISLISANGSNHLPTGAEITEIWASESQHYNYSRPAWSEKCQHFTQLVWKKTLEIGVARVWLPSTTQVAIVAFYSPSGNCNGINEFRDNVPKALADRPTLESIFKK